MNTIGDLLKADAAMVRKHSKNRVGDYYSVSDFLVRHGREFTAKPLLGEVTAGRAQQCFLTCADIATSHQRFTYCEGYACGIIPVFHAWLLDSDGQAIDPTWTGKGKRPAIGWQYFGVAIRTRYVIEHLCATERHGPILDNWEQRWPILTAPVDEWKA